MKCQRCNTEFPSRSNKKYCSRKCKTLAKDKRLDRNLTKWNKLSRSLRLNTVCSNCGFVPIHICQLDVDHIDGDHSNNDPNNLRTLCANCHRLKTWISKDWQKQ